MRLFRSPLLWFCVVSMGVWYILFRLVVRAIVLGQTYGGF